MPKFKKEVDKMYKELVVTFTSGDSRTFTKDEWDDYNCSDRYIAVKKDGNWIAVYNPPYVFSVELR